MNDRPSHRPQTEPAPARMAKRDEVRQLVQAASQGAGCEADEITSVLRSLDINHLESCSSLSDVNESEAAAMGINSRVWRGIQHHLLQKYVLDTVASATALSELRSSGNCDAHTTETAAVAAQAAATAAAVAAAAAETAKAALAQLRSLSSTPSNNSPVHPMEIAPAPSPLPPVHRCLANSDSSRSLGAYFHAPLPSTSRTVSPVRVVAPQAAGSPRSGMYPRSSLPASRSPLVSARESFAPVRSNSVALLCYAPVKQESPRVVLSSVRADSPTGKPACVSQLPSPVLTTASPMRSNSCLIYPPTYSLSPPPFSRFSTTRAAGCPPPCVVSGSLSSPFADMRSHSAAVLLEHGQQVLSSPTHKHARVIQDQKLKFDFSGYPGRSSMVSAMVTRPGTQHATMTGALSQTSPANDSGTAGATSPQHSMADSHPARTSFPNRQPPNREPPAFEKHVELQQIGREWKNEGEQHRSLIARQAVPLATRRQRMVHPRTLSAPKAGKAAVDKVANVNPDESPRSTSLRKQQPKSTGQSHSFHETITEQLAPLKSVVNAADEFRCNDRIGSPPRSTRNCRERKIDSSSASTGSNLVRACSFQRDKDIRRSSPRQRPLATHVPRAQRLPSTDRRASPGRSASPGNAAMPV